MKSNIELDVLDLSFSPKEACQISLFANKFANIKDLTLVQCEIEHLNSLCLNEMINLENLNLGVNRINNLGENHFVSLKKLKYLNLSFNKLAELTENSLYGMENLEVLDLNSNKIVKIHHRAFSSLSKLTNLDLNFNKIHTLSFEIFGDSRELSKLMIFENPIENIDESFLKKMKSLKEIDICKTLDSKNLETKKLVELLKISQCESLFVDCKVLDYLIKKIDEPLKSLKTVSISNLTKENVNILNKASEKLGENIEELKLSSSTVISLFSHESESNEDEEMNPDFILQKFKNLKRLAIVNMIISNVDISKCFDSLIQLTVVIDNQRKSEHLKMFEYIFRHKFRSLKHLSLKSCFINECLIEFNSTLLNRMRNLETLVLQKLFRFSSSANAFCKLKNLKKLEIYGNVIKTVSSELFQGLASLTQLSLEGNQIETIEPNAFKPLISLQKLNISVNQIKIFKSEHFTGLENNLRDLDISDNSIEEIELGTFKSLKLEKLKIY